MQFTESELSRATRNFYHNLKVGGGFGTVYKGCMRGTSVAVKVLSEVRMYLILFGDELFI